MLRVHLRRASSILHRQQQLHSDVHVHVHDEAASGSAAAARTEQLWKELFADPTQWWDNRSSKKTPKRPDFKHKRTLESLWLDCPRNPPWVEAKIAYLDLDYAQSGDWSRSSGTTSFSDNLRTVNKLCQEGQLKKACHLVQYMVQQTSSAPVVAYVTLLKHCARRKALEEGKQVHALVLQSGGYDSNLFLANNLVDMYSKCGSVLDACKVFDSMSHRNVFSWTAIMSAYAESGNYGKVIDLFQQMEKTGIVPDKVAFLIALKACARITSIHQGRRLHSLMLKRGLDLDVVVQNALVDLYAKCGCLKEARKLFKNMSKRDLVSWNAMIAGYVQNGLGKEALALYEQMKHEGIEADKVTFIAVLKACGTIAALEQGKQLHSLLHERGFELDVMVQTTLIDMYAKCGCLEDAREVFNNMNGRNVVSWNAMIAGYAQNGFGKEALALFEQMKQQTGVKPDKITFACILSALSRSGLVEEGCHVFDFMLKESGVTPTMEHYACMIDLLGRSRCLAKAEDFLKKMPTQPDSVIWMSLLRAARDYSDVKIGQHAFDCVVKLEPGSAAAYLLLLEIYSDAGNMEKAAEIKKQMADKGLEELSGYP